MLVKFPSICNGYTWIELLFRHAYMACEDEEPTRKPSCQNGTLFVGSRNRPSLNAATASSKAESCEILLDSSLPPSNTTLMVTQNE